jgi:flagellar hook-basal body complex protein FliE
MATGNFNMPALLDGQTRIPINGGSDFPATQVSSMATQTINEPTSWTQLVHKMVSDVNQAEQTAGAKVRDVLAGGPTPVHEALLATEEANTSFQVLAEMRNKAIDAYNEVKNMAV